MPSVRSLLLFGLPLLLVAHAQPHKERMIDISAPDEWDEKLQTLPAEALDAALEQHLRPKYQGGVFEDGHSAIAAVRADDPQLASKLIELAKQDADTKDVLRRRQNNNSTSGSSATSLTASNDDNTDTTTSTTATTTTPTTTSSVITTPTTPSSSSSSSDQSSSSMASSSSSASVGVPVGGPSSSESSVVPSTSAAVQSSQQTSRSSQDVSVTSTGLPPGESVISPEQSLVTSTFASGRSIVLTSPTSGGKYTVSDSGGAVVTVTYVPSRITVSKLKLQTTVLPNGSPTVITSYALVTNAGHTAGAGGSQSGDKPSLVSGAAAPSSWYAVEVAVVVGVAIGVAGIIL